MRILAVSNLYPPHYVGGYELRCEIAVRALRARGHTVQVLTSNHGTSPDAAPAPDEAADAAGGGVDRSLRIHGFFGHPWLGIRALRELEHHNNQRLRAQVAAFRPDVVHVWNLGGLSKSLCLTLQELGIPVVYDVSDHWIARSLVADVWLDWWNRPNPSLPARCLRALWSLTGARARWSRTAPTDPVRAVRFDRLYFCSRALRDLTVAAGYPVEHGAVIHCSVDTARFHGEPVPATRPLRRLLYVGRLSPDKGVLTALRALALVRGRVPAELHIYGRGEPAYEAQLRAFVAEHRLPVSFHTADAAAMPAVYRVHDALLFTSEWEEPFALTPLEAMASGLPVIGTTTGGSQELFRERENALTYRAGDASDLARQLVVLAADPELRARLARTGHAEVRARYAEAAIVDHIEQYLLASVPPATAAAPVADPLPALAVAAAA